MMESLPETQSHKRVKPPFKPLPCSNELCWCCKKGNCMVHEEVEMTCTPKVWWQSCGPRVKWEKLEKMMGKLLK